MSTKRQRNTLNPLLKNINDILLNKMGNKIVSCCHSDHRPPESSRYRSVSTLEKEPILMTYADQILINKKNQTEFYLK